MLTDVRNIILNAQDLIDSLVNTTRSLNTTVNNLTTASDIADDIVSDALTGEIPATAAKAISDEDGNNIVSTYSTKANTVAHIEVVGNTIAITKNDVITSAIISSVDTATYATSAGSAITATSATTATSADSAGVADKLDTSTIGGVSTPIYLSSGEPTACTSVIATSCTGNAATATSAVSAGYASSTGQIGTTTIGDATRPVYISSGVPARCGTSLAISCTSANSAGAAVSASVATQLGTTTIGDASSPVYISSGTPTSITVVASSTNATVATKIGTANVGTSSKPIYLAAGVPTECTALIATDEKVKTTVATTSKAYIAGTVSNTATTGELVIDTGVYLDTTAGMLTATTFKGALSGNAATATSAASAGSAVSAASCTGKDTAGRVGTTIVGSTTRPVYISSGIPVSCGTSLAVSCTSANSAGSAVSAASCTGNAATATSATSAGYAVSAGKIGTTTIGGAAAPVYISSGTPVQCTGITATSAASAGYATSAGYCTGNCAGTANYANSAGKCTGAAATATSPNSAGYANSAGSCTGNAATATSAVNAGYAASAGRLGTATVGNASTGVYLSAGYPVAVTGGGGGNMSCTSAAVTVYCNSFYGDDGLDGTSYAQSYKTLARALTDTAKLKSNNYVELKLAGTWWDASYPSLTVPPNSRLNITLVNYENESLTSDCMVSLTNVTISNGSYVQINTNGMTLDIQGNLSVSNNSKLDVTGTGNIEITGNVTVTYNSAVRFANTGATVNGTTYTAATAESNNTCSVSISGTLTADENSSVIFNGPLYSWISGTVTIRAGSYLYFGGSGKIIEFNSQVNLYYGANCVHSAATVRYVSNLCVHKGNSTYAVVSGVIHGYGQEWIYVEHGGSFYMQGGTITRKATDYDYPAFACNAGDIYIESSASVTIERLTMNYGARVRFASGTLNIYGNNSTNSYDVCELNNNSVLVVAGTHRYQDTSNTPAHLVWVRGRSAYHATGSGIFSGVTSGSVLCLTEASWAKLDTMTLSGKVTGTSATRYGVDYQSVLNAGGQGASIPGASAGTTGSHGSNYVS